MNSGEGQKDFSSFMSLMTFEIRSSHLLMRTTHQSSCGFSHRTGHWKICSSGDFNSRTCFASFFFLALEFSPERLPWLDNTPPPNPDKDHLFVCHKKDYFLLHWQSWTSQVGPLACITCEACFKPLSYDFCSRAPPFWLVMMHTRHLDSLHPRNHTWSFLQCH